MTLKEFNKLPPGLYEIYWKTGGSSLAAIGNDEHGHRWLAPINWLSPMEWASPYYIQHIRGIKSAIKVAIR